MVTGTTAASGIRKKTSPLAISTAAALPKASASSSGSQYGSTRDSQNAQVPRALVGSETSTSWAGERGGNCMIHLIHIHTDE